MFSRQCTKPIPALLVWEQEAAWEVNSVEVQRAASSFTKSLLYAKRSFPWSQCSLCCSITTDFDSCSCTESLIDPTEITEEVCRKAKRVKSTLPTGAFTKASENPFQQMLPLQIGWCWLKGSLARTTKGLILHFPPAASAANSSRALQGAEIQTLRGKGWEPSPGLSNTLGGVISIYIQYKIPRSMTGNTKPPPSPSAAVSSSESGDLWNWKWHSSL